MSEETGITVVAAIAIVVVVILAIVLVHHVANQQNRGPQPGQAQEPNSPA